MSRKTEIQVGVTVLVAIAVLLWGIAWLSTIAKANIQRVWHVRFDQAGGLNEGNDVQVNGVRKGVVKSMRLVDDHVVLDLALAKDVEITRDSRVVIRSVSMMGDKAVVIDYRMGGGDWSTRDTIPGLYEKGLTEVMADLGHATGSLTGLAAQIDSMTAAITRGGGLSVAVANFVRTTQELSGAVSENRAALKTTLANFSETSGAAKDLLVGREQKLGDALDHFASTAAKLDRLTTQLDSLRGPLQSAVSKVGQGQGTLGKLVNDDRLYADLTSSARELRQLIQDIKANPRKYLKFSVF